jgi:hypothetical protein
LKTTYKELVRMAEGDHPVAAIKIKDLVSLPIKEGAALGTNKVEIEFAINSKRTHGDLKRR